MTRAFALLAVPLLALATITAAAQTAGAPSGPVANAAADQTLECAGPAGTPARLDGGASHPVHENDTLVSYAWYAGYGTSEQRFVSHHVTVDLTLPVGVHTFTLVVTNSTNATFTDNVTITVADTLAPTLEVSLDRETMWPPNHKMKSVGATVSAWDQCDGGAEWKLLSVVSDEADNGQGDGNSVGDVQGADEGTRDTSFSLRSERAGPGDGRVYTATYQAWDKAGHATNATASVVVPHDMG